MLEIKFLEKNQYLKELVESIRPLNEMYPSMLESPQFHDLLITGFEDQFGEFSKFLGDKIKVKAPVLIMMVVLQLRGYGLCMKDTRQTIGQAKKDSKAQLLDDLDVSYVIMRDINMGLQKLTAKGVLLDTLKPYLKSGDSSSSESSSS